MHKIKLSIYSSQKIVGEDNERVVGVYYLLSVPSR
jgi:hypothetical protein